MSNEMPVLRRHWHRDRSSFECVGESMTEQSHGPEVDINNILRRHARSGILPPVTVPPQYADVTRMQMSLADRIRFVDEQKRVFREVAPKVQADLDKSKAEAASAAPPVVAPSPS